MKTSLFKSLLWFVLFWLLSVGSLALVAYLLRAIMKYGVYS